MGAKERRVIDDQLAAATK